jgi:hypothetical protein
MTEAVNAPSDLAAFKATDAACSQTNVVAGSELDTNLLAITGPTSGWNNDHLLLTFDDWRTIDDSEHFTSNAQNLVANQIGEGSSLNDLLQIVSITDANNVAATAGNGRGVLIVDATPPLATALTHDGTTVTAKFDQSLRLADSGGATGEFQLLGQGDGGGAQTTYTFEITSATAGTVSRDTDYVGPYGQTLAADTDIAVSISASANADDNVPANVSNSQIAVSINESTETVDFSHFFNELSHNDAASFAGTAGADYYLDYPDLMDTNFNSWRNVETYDQYDGANTPALLGADEQGPIVQTVAQGLASPYLDADEVFLHEDTSAGFAVASMHVTAAGDTDSIYSAAGLTAGAGYTVGANADVSVAHVWGTATGTTITANTPNGELLVIKLDTDAVDVTDAVAYYYQPENTTDTVDGAAVTFTNTITVAPTGQLTAGVALAGSVNVAPGEVGLRDNDANNGDNDVLVVAFPNLTARTIASTDALVIQNVKVGGVFYSLHIAAPAAVNELVTATPVAEANLSLPTVTYYKHVLLGADVEALQPGNDYGPTGYTAAAAYTATGTISYREAVQSASATWAIGVDHDTTGTSTTTDAVVDFSESASVGTGANDGTVTYNLDALAAGSVSESVNQTVGHNSSLTVTTTDFSNQTSTLVMTFRKGHDESLGDVDNNGAVQENELAILNIIDGSAID